ncbi:hypothetical protein Cni_G21234 [Canna indica]|uniref:SKP1 component dimerisation domain-containing protein n=1 Tax=Canna indica TaxID=4628 RepID=A0AAQ3KVF0_9LILI|nr:hypothetical protein Cni_G21234 [Canna indica]
MRRPIAHRRPVRRSSTYLPAVTAVETRKQDRDIKLTVVFMTADGQEIVHDAVIGKVPAKYEELIRTLKDGEVVVIHVPNNITGRALNEAVNFWIWRKWAAGAGKSPEEINNFAGACVTKLEDWEARLDVYVAALYLATKGGVDVTPLLDAAARGVADDMESMSTSVEVEQAKEYFGVEEKKLLDDLASADFAEEEEEKPDQEIVVQALPAMTTEETGKQNRVINTKVVLKAADGQEITVDATFGKVAAKYKERLQTLKNGDVLAIPLPSHVTGRALGEVVKFWKWRRSTGAEKSPKEVKNFAEACVMELEEEAARLEVYVAADYVVMEDFFVDATPLLQAASQGVADAVKTMSVEQARDYFGVASDFREEEEKKLRNDFAWAHNI